MRNKIRIFSTLALGLCFLAQHTYAMPTPQSAMAKIQADNAKKAALVKQQIEAFKKTLKGYEDRIQNAKERLKEKREALEILDEKPEENQSRNNHAQSDVGQLSDIPEERDQNQDEPFSADDLNKQNQNNEELRKINSA